MSRLIDADELLEPVGSYDPKKYTWEYGMVVTVEDIKKAPTVDVVDRKLFNKVCEMFAEYADWICDELNDFDRERCTSICEFFCCQPQCIERYITLKMDEVTE